MKKIINIGLISSVLLGVGLPSVSLAADLTAVDNSHVNGKALPGTFRIQADDADLGKLVIGKTINDVDSEVRVLDNSGGQGWQATVKSMNYDKINPSLIESVKVGDSDKTLITSEDSRVHKGPSILDEQKFKATYSAEWGVKPEAGNANNELLWTLTPAIKTMEDTFKENVTFGFNYFNGIKGLKADNPIDYNSFIEFEGNGNSYVKYPGLYGKINDKNELNLTFDISEFSYDEENSATLTEELSQINVGREALGMTEIPTEGNVKWLFAPMEVGTIGLSSPVNISDMLISDNGNSMVEDVYEIREPLTFYGEQSIATNEHPTSSTKMRVILKDGSSFDFTYNLTITGEPKTK